MTDQTIDQIFEDVLKKDREAFEELQRISQNINSGGKQRGKHGTHNEELVKYVVSKIGEFCDVKSVIKKLKRKDLRIFNDGGSLSISLDWHIYGLTSSPLIIMEIKSYMEACMLKRLLYETQKLKKIYPSTIIVAVQFEDAFGPDSRGFVENEEDIDYILTLTDRKRDSDVKRFSSEDGLVKNNCDFKELCRLTYDAFEKEKIKVQNCIAHYIESIQKNVRSHQEFRKFVEKDLSQEFGHKVILMMTKVPLHTVDKEKYYKYSVKFKIGDNFVDVSTKLSEQNIETIFNLP